MIFIYYQFSVYFKIHTYCILNTKHDYKVSKHIFKGTISKNCLGPSLRPRLSLCILIKHFSWNIEYLKLNSNFILGATEQ